MRARVPQIVPVWSFVLQHCLPCEHLLGNPKVVLRPGNSVDKRKEPRDRHKAAESDLTKSAGDLDAHVAQEAGTF
jgi:hypothetical protein